MQLKFHSSKVTHAHVSFNLLLCRKLTFRLLAVIPSLCTSSSASSFSKYGRRLNARSSSKTSIGEKVVRCRFFFVECSVGVEA